jgi:hypothetical protein
VSGVHWSEREEVRAKEQQQLVELSGGHAPNPSALSLAHELLLLGRSEPGAAAAAQRSFAQMLLLPPPPPTPYLTPAPRYFGTAQEREEVRIAIEEDMARDDARPFLIYPEGCVTTGVSAVMQYVRANERARRAQRRCPSVAEAGRRRGWRGAEVGKRGGCRGETPRTPPGELGITRRTGWRGAPAGFARCFARPIRSAHVHARSAGYYKTG